MEPSAIRASCEPQAEPAHFVEKGGELFLSGQALKELISNGFDKGASFRFRAKGFSMSPFIKDGDVITVAPLRGATPSFGDVVVSILPGRGKLVIHRVVGKRADSYLVKGDNVFESDGMVPEANILGYVRRVERDGKKISRGFGPEKVLIGFLTRSGLLSPLLLSVVKVVRFARRRSQK